MPDTTLRGTEMTEKSPNVPDGMQPPPGNGLSTPILVDPLTERKDIGLTSRAIRERWNISDFVRDQITERLLKVVAKESVEVMTSKGPQSLEYPADVNAIAASRVLVAMESQNQSDEQFDAKIDDAKQNPNGNTYNVGCVGQIALGQEPLTPEDAKRQAQEVLARVKARIGPLAPLGTNNIVVATPLPSKPLPAMPSGLADL